MCFLDVKPACLANASVETSARGSLSDALSLRRKFFSFALLLSSSSVRLSLVGGREDGSCMRCTACGRRALVRGYGVPSGGGGEWRRVPSGPALRGCCSSCCLHNRFATAGTTSALLHHSPMCATVRCSAVLPLSPWRLADPFRPQFAHCPTPFAFPLRCRSHNQNSTHNHHSSRTSVWTLKGGCVSRTHARCRDGSRRSTAAAAPAISATI
jgi:hypothetical protein